MKKLKSITYAFKEMHRLESKLMPTTVTAAVVTGIMPFVNIWFSAKIIDLLDTGAEAKTLIGYICLAVGINFVLFFLNRYLNDIYYMLRSMLYNRELKSIASKLFSVEFKKLEDSNFKELIHKHSEAQDRVFSAFVQFSWMFRDFVSGALTVIISAVLILPLFRIAEQNPDAIEEILAGAFEHRPELFLEPGAADEFLNQRMSDLMDAMNFGEVAETVDSNLTHEDFSNRKQNYPKQDFNRKWNHTRTKTQVVSMSNVDEKYPVEDAIDIAEAKAVIEALPEEDRKILLLHIQGYTQEEIAKKLGYKAHSAVGKKLKKIKAQLKTTV